MNSNPVSYFTTGVKDDVGKEMNLFAELATRADVIQAAEDSAWSKLDIFVYHAIGPNVRGRVHLRQERQSR